jgi:OFA family oxalate/formate antiporter-like MFS transporter
MSNNNSKGWTVLFAGTGVNLALGVLYTWSVFSQALTEQLHWTKTQATLPYSVACIVFAIMMVPAGRLQDKYGPRLVVTLGGALTGIGMIIGGLTNSLTALVIGFGVLVGTGMGLGYSSATPAAVKWFPPHKKGMVTGLVVAGFGLASVYIAPLTKTLISSFGVSQAFVIEGIGFLVVIMVLAQFIKNPPPGYVPEGMLPASSPKSSTNNHQYEWHEMIKTPQFFLLWLMFAFGSSAGLMIIGQLAKIANVQVHVAWGFIFVALLAIFNAGGRVVAGIVSDMIGRTRTMLIVFLFQAIVMFLFIQASTVPFMALAAAATGFNYGALLSLFPSTTFDYFGTKNGGVNYGLVFTAWGVGGLIGPLLAGRVIDATGTYGMAYTVAALLCLAAAGLSLITKTPKVTPALQSIKTDAQL